MRPPIVFRPAPRSTAQRRLQFKHGIPGPIAKTIAELIWGTGQ
ncbi:MAG: hypothetical protein R3D80_07755 [Paracoccaceae bacterium]